MDALAEISELIAQHAPTDGFHDTPVGHLSLVRSSTPTMPMPNVYCPLLCLVGQGTKQVSLGDQMFLYSAGRYGLVSADLPVIGQVVEATPAKPYLCMVLDFNPQTLGELSARVPIPADASTAPLGKTVAEANQDLLEAALRLLRLLNDPEALRVLAPLAEQEILYRLLTGPNANLMRQITCGQGRIAQVGRAIAWLRQHHRERLSIEQLAAHVGMSPSSLHQHFRAVTAMTPLQFHKELRLQDARSMMLLKGIDATTTAFEVGYESVSQFTREYRRLFGEPPARDIARLRASPELALVA